MAVKLNVKMAAAKMKSEGTTVSGTLRFVSLPTFMRICAYNHQTKCNIAAAAILNLAYFRCQFQSHDGFSVTNYFSVKFHECIIIPI